MAASSRIEPSPAGDALSGLWNSLSLEQPPSVQMKYIPNESTEHIKACFYGLKKATSLLTKSFTLKLLTSELFVLSRLIYKGNNSFRHHMFLRWAKKIEKCLWRFHDYPLLSSIQKLLSSWPSDHEVDSRPAVLYVPSRQMLQYLLVRLQGSATLLHQTLVYCTNTMGHVLHMLQLGLHTPQMLVFAGVVARIWSLCRCLKKEVMDWYTTLHKNMDYLKASEAQWLVGELPQVLKSFLGEEPGITPPKSPEEVSEMLRHLEDVALPSGPEQMVPETELSVLEDIGVGISRSSEDLGVAISRSSATSQTSTSVQLRDILKDMGLGGDAEKKSGSSTSAVDTVDGHTTQVEEQQSIVPDAEPEWHTELPSGDDSDDMEGQTELIYMDSDTVGDTLPGLSLSGPDTDKSTASLEMQQQDPARSEVTDLTGNSDLDENLDNVEQKKKQLKNGFKQATRLNKYYDQINKCASVEWVKKIVRKIRQDCQNVGSHLVHPCMKQLIVLQKSPQSCALSGAQNLAIKLITGLRMELIVQEALRQTAEQRKMETDGEACVAAIYQGVSNALSDAAQLASLKNQVNSHQVVFGDCRVPLAPVQVKCMTELFKMMGKSGKPKALIKQRDVLDGKMAAIKNYLIRVLCHALGVHVNDADSSGEHELTPGTVSPITGKEEIAAREDSSQAGARKKIYYMLNKRLCSLTNFKRTMSSLKKGQFKIKGVFYPLRPDADVSNLESKIHEHAQLLASFNAHQPRSQRQYNVARTSLVDSLVGSLDLSRGTQHQEPHLAATGGKGARTLFNDTELENTMGTLKRDQNASSLLDTAAAVIVLLGPNDNQEDLCDLFSPTLCRNEDDCDITLPESELKSFCHVTPVNVSDCSACGKKPFDFTTGESTRLQDQERPKDRLQSSLADIVVDLTVPSGEHTRGPVPCCDGAPALQTPGSLSGATREPLTSAIMEQAPNSSSQPHSQPALVSSLELPTTYLRPLSDPVLSTTLEHPSPEPSNDQALRTTLEHPIPPSDPSSDPAVTATLEHLISTEPSSDPALSATLEHTSPGPPSDPALSTTLRHPIPSLDPSSDTVLGANLEHPIPSSEPSNDPALSTTLEHPTPEPSNDPALSATQEYPSLSSKPSTEPAVIAILDCPHPSEPLNKPAQSANLERPCVSEPSGEPALIATCEHPGPSAESPLIGALECSGPCSSEPSGKPSLSSPTEPPNEAVLSASPKCPALSSTEQSSLNPCQNQPCPTKSTDSTPASICSLDSTDEEDSDCCILSPHKEEPPMIVISDPDSDDDEARPRQFASWYEDRLPGPPQPPHFQQVLTGSFPRNFNAKVTAVSSGSSHSFQGRLGKRRRTRGSGSAGDVWHDNGGFVPLGDTAGVPKKKNRKKKGTAKLWHEYKKRNNQPGAASSGAWSANNGNKHAAATKGSQAMEVTGGAKRRHANRYYNKATGGANANKGGQANKPNVVVGANAEPIPNHNIGSQLLQRMGWTPGNGLGRGGTGITAPVEAILRHGRKGLGTEDVNKESKKMDANQNQRVPTRPYNFPKPCNSRIVFEDD